MPFVVHWGDVPFLVHFGDVPFLCHFGNVPFLCHLGDVPFLQQGATAVPYMGIGVYWQLISERDNGHIWHMTPNAHIWDMGLNAHILDMSPMANRWQIGASFAIYFPFGSCPIYWH